MILSKKPLAEQLRPKSLDEIIGQKHLLSPDAPFRKLVEARQLTNIILYGPPGIGKSTIADIIAAMSDSRFVKLNATSFSVKDLRKVCDTDEHVVVYIDEIYRLSSNQADVLLPYTESGNITLIGATTENPFHTLKAALVSRSNIFEMHPLSHLETGELLLKAKDYYKSIGQIYKIDKDAFVHLIRVSCGDGRKVINLFEFATQVCKDNHIDLELVRTIAPNKYHVYSSDKKYDWASAIQGSIQASDPDSAIFFLAQALESGEDPRYIARRILVSASEDAAGSPHCVAVALSAYKSAHEIGRPECDIILAHAVTQIASSPRDKSAACAIWDALKDVRNKAEVEVPKQMRDCHYKGAEILGNGAYHDGMNQAEYVGVNKRYYKPEDWI